MLKHLRIRYSLNALLFVCGSVSLLMGSYVARIHVQDSAIALIEKNGGMVGRFNEWLVIGVDEKSEFPSEYVTRSSLINREVLTIRVSNEIVSDEICDAIESLPTVEFIQITGGCTQAELQQLERRFPGIEIEDMEIVIAELFGR